VSGVSAYDPSTWGDEQHGINEARYEPGGDLGPEPTADDDTPVLIPDADALIAERDELQTAFDGASRKLERLRGFVDAGQAEADRLGARLLEVTELLRGGEPDGVER
jgi:hypothetical protein